MTTMTRLAGSPSSRNYRQIGTVTLLEPRVMTRHYECAAWHTSIRVEPGVYPVRSNGYWLLIAYTGTVVDEAFPSVFGGVQYANKNDGRNVGKADTYTSQGYAYSIHQLPNFTPADDVHIDVESLTSDDGRTYTYGRIYTVNPDAI